MNRLGGHAVVDQALQEDPADHHREYVDDKEPEGKSSQRAQQDEKDDGQALRAGDGGAGGYQRHEDGAGAQII